MNTHRPKSTSMLILSAAMLLVTLVVGAFALRPPIHPPLRTSSPQEQKIQVPVTSQANLPVVISKVKRLEAVSATVKEGGPSPFVQIEVRNKSDVAVREITISNGVLAEVEYGLTYGQGDPDNPIIAIEPNGTKTFNIPLANLDGKYPILISGAVFADATEDGDKQILERMSRSREERRKEVREQRQKGEIQ